MDLADAAVLAATVLSVGTLVPQALRLHRTRDTAGVSVTWTALGAVTNTGWFVYSVHQHLWSAIPATIASVLFYAALGVGLRRLGAHPGRSSLFGLLWGVILAGVGVIGGFKVLGLVLGTSYGVQVAPSVWTAYRTYRPSGLSAGTWALALVQVLLWAVYGIANHDTAVVTFAITGVTASLLMLGRWVVTRDRPALASA